MYSFFHSTDRTTALKSAFVHEVPRGATLDYYTITAIMVREFRNCQKITGSGLALLAQGQAPSWPLIWYSIEPSRDWLIKKRGKRNNDIMWEAESVEASYLLLISHYILLISFLFKYRRYGWYRGLLLSWTPGLLVEMFLKFLSLRSRDLSGTLFIRWLMARSADLHHTITSNTRCCESLTIISRRVR